MVKEASGFRNRKLIIFLVLALVFVLLGVYFSFVQPEECLNLECFQEKMKSCDSAVFINEDSGASWRYEVFGEEDRVCVIDVTLLQVKEGELNVEGLAGYGMTCRYPTGVFAYPEKNIERCHGRLKEELQGIMIQKLHTHIIENLGEIEAGLEEIIV